MTEAAAFIARWAASGAAERANYQLFLSELCDLIGVARPEPAQADDSKNTYVFERSVSFPEGGIGRIDLYKQGCFVLEAKQGSDRERQAEFELALTPPTAKSPKKGTAVRGTKGWDDAMIRARGQAFAYAQALPVAEGWPPFLIVVDVGHSIELYADFSGMGKHYAPFPDARSFRLMLGDLVDAKLRERLHHVWQDPLSLDPARHAAKVTREIADRLALLAKSMEQTHAPQTVANFLMRCLFTMFAEDVGLLPKDSFRNKLIGLKGQASKFQPLMRELWQTMDRGGFSAALAEDVLQFNGGLFKDADALPVTEEQLALLVAAADRDWRAVEPAIFGTLLERALDPGERHRLGAHYTPRAYVDRLVLPTVIDPLRSDWDASKAAAFAEASRGDMEAAKETVKLFHNRLCNIRVLDPACGSGNFLYATMEHMKRLEGEVLDFLTTELGERESYLDLERHSVDPHQFLGLEVNPRAVEIAELVLWIGYLQWHFRTRGNAMPSQPVLRNFHNIVRQDAILAYDSEELLRDEHGKPITRWDGVTMKTHPVTGEQVPDEAAQAPIYRYLNPRKADWPQADFIIGNPPFIGGKDIRAELGDGYAEALWAAHPDLPNSIDFVMYWWDKAATLVEAGHAQRFGFITTNSLPQTFSRRVVAKHLDGKLPLSVVFAIPDHPWVKAIDEAGVRDAAAVRVAMTVGVAGSVDGRLCRVVAERPGHGDGVDVDLTQQFGKLHADLRIGADVSSAMELVANEGLSSPGVKLHGAGFIVTESEANRLGMGSRPGIEDHLRLYRNGKDLAASPRNVRVIDMFGLEEGDVKSRFPEAYQWLFDRVWPDRSQSANRTADSLQYAKFWWLFGKPRPDLRRALAGLTRYIATVETAKHRVFQFLDASILPDNMLIAIALDDPYSLGVLSSRIHVIWALAAGGRLGVGNDPRYNKTRCFDPFPFPVCAEQLKARIRDIGERLDKHRKDRQALHADLTITGMYNVLEKLRGGQPLDAKDKVIHEKGLVSILKQLHDELDAAVAEAYGWPVDLADEEILTRLVALNHQRAAEEKRGIVHWLRPDFQAPAAKPTQTEIDIGAPIAKPKKGKAVKQVWPKSLPDQVQAIRSLLVADPAPIASGDIAKRFTGARSDRIEEVLAALVALGQAREASGRFTA